MTLQMGAIFEIKSVAMTQERVPLISKAISLLKRMQAYP